MSKAKFLLVAGLVLIITPVVYLWINEYSLFPENEPTTPGLIRVLFAGLTFLVGLGILLAAAVYAQADRASTARQSLKEAAGKIWLLAESSG